MTLAGQSWHRDHQHMSLVERFIEVQGWPTSRKVALAAAYTAALSVLNFGLGQQQLKGINKPVEAFELS